MKLQKFFRLVKLSVDGRNWVELEELETFEEAMEFIKDNKSDLLDYTLKVEPIYKWI